MPAHEDPDFDHLPRLTLAEVERRGRGLGANDPVLLVVDGRVFDVSKGRGFYGPGGAYHVLAGRDATRAFALDTTDERVVLERPGDTSDLSATQMLRVDGWLDKLEAKYPVVGVVVPASAEGKSKL